MKAPAVKGEPAISVGVPLAAIANAEIVPEEPFATYSVFPFGAIDRNCGFGATSEAKLKGEPATGDSRPFVVSTLKTEMVAGAAVAGGTAPWFNTNKNVPAESTANESGLEHAEALAHTGVGGSAVPTGVSIPVVWSRLKPETVPAVWLAT